MSGIPPAGGKRRSKIALFLKNAIDHLQCGWSLTFEQSGRLSGHREVVEVVVREEESDVCMQIFLKGWRLLVLSELLTAKTHGKLVATQRFICRPSSVGFFFFNAAL